MNTAELTVQQITRVRVRARKPSTLERIALVKPWVSPSSRAELEHVESDVKALQKANRHLAVALADAHDEIERLRGGQVAA